MIRVAHLLPNMAIGGRERIVADLCGTSAAHGVEPVVISYDLLGSEEKKKIRHPGFDPGSSCLLQSSERSGIPDQVRDDDAGISENIPLPDHVPLIPLDRRAPDFATALARILAEHGIDILHAQGHVAAALARPVMRATPTIATLHVALGSGWRWLPAITRGLRGAHTVTAVSDDLARRFRSIAGQPIRTIPTAVDIERFTPAARFGSNLIFTVGIAARLHPVKRHLDAIAALRLLARRGLPCRLRIAGDGPEAARIRAAATGLDVEMLGTVNDMPAFLASLDAFLLPSDHEGTPAALLEAMATGLPCIATAVGGVPALVGDAALLVPRRDPAALAAGLADLHASEALRERLGAAARRRAERFGLDRQAAAYASVYRSILAEQSAARSDGLTLASASRH